MNIQYIHIKLPIDIARDIVLQLPPGEKRGLLEQTKPSKAKKPSLYGYLKGIKISEKDIKEAKKILFPHVSS